MGFLVKYFPKQKRYHMSNLKRFLTLILLLVLCTSLQAQENFTFKVIVNKGKNEFKSGATWQPIKVGASLLKSDELRLSENSYMGLMHTSGKPLELKHSGKYKVVDLANKMKEGTSVISKYTDFILSSSENPKNSLKATGAVHRGSNITLYLPVSDQALIFNDEITFGWDKDKIPGPYEVVFNSLFEDELHHIETADNVVSVNMNDPLLSNEDNIIVYVISKSDPNKVSERYSLRRLSKADNERIKSQLQEYKLDVEENSAINKLYLASFFEENSLLIDAATALQEAIKLEPEVPFYQEAYQGFLIRNGLKK